VKHSYLADGHTQASREGWGTFKLDDGTIAIQRLDEGPFSVPVLVAPGGAYMEQSGVERWSDDRYAIAHVRRQARKGSAYHARALKLAKLKA
jgi:hypothetical protein